MRNLFIYLLVLLSLGLHNVYTASAPMAISPSCTFEPGMGKALEVLAYLDESYKNNSYGDLAILIYSLVRTGDWTGNFEGKPITLKGIRYGKPADANETCLMYKALIRTNAQTFGKEQLRETLLKNAVGKIRQFQKEGKREDFWHQLIVLIVSTLTYSQQTVSTAQIVENTKNILTKALTIPDFTDINPQALEKVITSIWKSPSFRTAIDIIQFEQERDIKEGNNLVREGDKLSQDKEKQKELYKKVLKLYWNVANQGDPHARFLLGKLYAKGLGLGPRESEKAVSILMEAPERDNADALLTLEQMAQKGNADASFALKKIFMQGLLSTSKNLNEAFKWLRKAVEQDHPQAQYELARFYLKEGKYKNIEEAVSLLNGAAKQGHPQAQYELYLFYLKEPNKNEKLALRWLRAAAKNSHEKAQQQIEALNSKEGEGASDENASVKVHME